MLNDEIKSIVKLSANSGLAQSMVNRIINCEASATAKAMDRQAYELLIRDCFPPVGRGFLFTSPKIRQF